MIRVLFLCHRYTDVSHGGLAEFLHFLPLALKKQGIESIIYTPPLNHAGCQLSEPYLLENNIPHYTGPLLKPRLFSTNKALQPLISLCQREKINILHAQGIYRAGYMAMQLKKYKNLPYIATSHSDILANNSKRMLQHRIHFRCQKILKNADYVTHLSPLMAEAAKQFYPSKSSKIIHNGIDINEWENYSAVNEKNYLLAIGRLEPEKGFPVLIEAYARLLKKGISTSLVIAGTGSIELSLQQQAKNLQLNVVISQQDLAHIPERSVIFTGSVKGDLKKQLFAQTKLVLFATQGKKWQEPFGIVQLEAMAAGKALIASDITIVRYLQSQGMQALLVKEDDIDGWTETITALLANPNLREIMGKNNKVIAEKFSWDLIANEYATVYKTILNSSSL